MEIIYIDRLFFLNLGIDYLLLLGAGRVCGLALRRGRYALSALLGGLYAALSLVPELAFLSLPAFKLCSGVLMALIAFGGEERFFRCAAVFFAVSAAFGGIIWALGLHSDVGGSAVYVPLSLPMLCFAFGLSYAGLSLVFRRTVKGREKRIYSAAVGLDGREISLHTLSDSGNTLFDPISGKRVLVASPSRLKELFPEGLATEPSALVTAYPGVFRLVPYSSVGGGGLLAAFSPDSLRLDGQERSDVLVAVSPTEIHGDGFEAVLGE